MDNPILKNQRRKLWILSAVFGVLMWLSWPPLPFTFLVLVGFVPLLIIEDIISKHFSTKSNKTLLTHSYLAFLIWNLTATFWVWNSSPAGSIIAFLLNSLLMCIPILLFHKVKRTLGASSGYIALVLFWIAFEFLHMRWDGTWPWLNLGNVFAGRITWIQWYEFTGTLGGTLWVLLINILVFKVIQGTNWYSKQFKIQSLEVGLSWKQLVIPCLLVLIPILISVQMYRSHQEIGTDKEIVVVQPNIDPYNEKFDLSTKDTQLNTFIRLTKSKVTEHTDYIVWPETAIPHGIWIDNMMTQPAMRRITDFIEPYPQVSLVTGISAYKFYSSSALASKTARPLSKPGQFYDAYNSAVIVGKDVPFQIYHKSKLVPGVEKVPFIEHLGILRKLVIDLGGVSGTLGTQKERTPLYQSDSVGIASAICYESVFGEFVTDYINAGAQAIFIVTNDGWWGNTPGHVQHLHYASLRSIETRKSIARSANTGISCFINQRGDILQATQYWEPDVIIGTIKFNDIKTFYTKHGDYIGRFCAGLGLLVLLYSFVVSKTNRRFN